MESLKLALYLEKYQEYLSKVRNHSPLSIEAYMSDLSRFQKFHQDNPGNWKSREYLSRFLKKLFHQNYANSSIYRYRSSLTSFFDYLVKEKLISSSPAKWLGRYKRKRTLPKIWPQTKVEKVIKKLESKKAENKTNRYRENRDLLITEMLYGLGLRISELTHIKVKEIGEEVVMIQGKGGYHQLLPLTPRLSKKIHDYLHKRGNFLSFLKKEDYGYLFLNFRGNPLTVRGARYAFQSRLITQKLDCLHPHGLRHSLAGHLLENGAGIRQVQKVLRHRSIATTQIYTQLSSQFLKGEYHKNHPLARLPYNKSGCKLKKKPIR